MKYHLVNDLNHILILFNHLLEMKMSSSTMDQQRRRSAALTTQEVLSIQTQNAQPNPFVETILDYQSKFNVGNLDNLKESNGQYKSELKHILTQRNNTSLNKELSLVPKPNLIELFSILCYTINSK